MRKGGFGIGAPGILANTDAPPVKGCPATEYSYSMAG
jgi:hypothetical protein